MEICISLVVVGRGADGRHLYQPTHVGENSESKDEASRHLNTFHRLAAEREEVITAAAAALSSVV